MDLFQQVYHVHVTVTRTTKRSPIRLRPVCGRSSSVRASALCVPQQTRRRPTKCQIFPISDWKTDNTIVSAERRNRIVGSRPWRYFPGIHSIPADTRTKSEQPTSGKQQSVNSVQRALGADQQIVPSMRHQVQCDWYATLIGVWKFNIKLTSANVQQANTRRLSMTHRWHCIWRTRTILAFRPTNAHRAHPNDCANTFGTSRTDWREVYTSCTRLTFGCLATILRMYLDMSLRSSLGRIQQLTKPLIKTYPKTLWY